MRAVNEQGARYQGKVACHDGAGNGAEQSGELGHKGHDNEKAADEVADPAGCHPGDLREGDRARMDDYGHGAGNAAQDIADTAACERALHLPEVYRFGRAARDALERNRLAIGLNGNDDAEEYERRQNGPKRDTKVGRQVRPFRGQSHPRRLSHPLEFVYALTCRNQTADDDTDWRRPKAQQRRTAKGEHGNHEERCQRGYGRRRGFHGGRLVQERENYGSQRDGKNHHHRAANGWRDQAPQDEEPFGNDELADAGYDNQHCQGRRSAVHHRRDTERYGKSRREHGQHSAAANRSDAPHLQERGNAHHYEGGKDHPDKVGVVSARCFRYNYRRNQEGGGSKQTELKPITQTCQERRVFMRLVTWILRGL